MKSISLFQVFDNIGQRYITEPIPCVNKLTAALGFFNSYIKEKDKNKNPFSFKALRLDCLCTFETDSIGKWHSPVMSDWSCDGKDIKNFISSEMAALGVDDFFDSEEVED